MSSPGPAPLQGTLDMLILQVVAHGPIHGYSIAQRIQYLSREAVQVPQTSVYPALHGLEDRKLIESDWTASDLYRLTDEGRAQLEVEIANWTRLADAIALILPTAQGETQ